MKPGDALILRNWFPTDGDCVIRSGMADHMTGITGTVESLAVHNAATGTSKMFAATDSGIYDASSAGAAGASVATSTNGYWQHVNYGDGTNNWLIMVNGTDKPAYYSGSAWVLVDGGTSPALTGLTTTSAIGVFVHKKRLWFIEKNSLSAWYLAAGAAGGALTEFDFSSIAKKGGYLVAGGTWSVDAGDGQDDLLALVTSEGEVIVYQGNDPSSASAWLLVGLYDLGEPMGRRCLQRFGGDLLILTQNGLLPLSSVLQARDFTKRLAVSDRVSKGFEEASRLYGANVGWEAIVFPARSALIVNVPMSVSESKQYVMNTTTKAWCDFTGWNATCFAVFNGALYFGEGSQVRQAWTGASDDGANIIADVKEAFSKFGTDEQKRCTLQRPILLTNGTISYLTGMDVDFRDTTMVGEATYIVTSGGLWDVALWDAAYWGSNLDVVRMWRSPAENVGVWFAPKLRVSTNSLEVHLMASDVVFERGQGI